MVCREDFPNNRGVCGKRGVVPEELDAIRLDAKLIHDPTSDVSWVSAFPYTEPLSQEVEIAWPLATDGWKELRVEFSRTVNVIE